MKKYLFLLALVLLQACSGSNDDTALFDNLYATSGLQGDGTATVRITELAASDSADIVYAGILEQTKGSPEMLNGVLLTPHELSISFRDVNSSRTVRATMHSDERGSLVRLAIEDGAVCHTDSPDGTPQYVEIGDSGVLSPMTCDDKTTMKRDWRAEAGDNATANIIQSITITNAFDAVTHTADVSYATGINGELAAALQNGLEPPTDPYCGGGGGFAGDQISCTAFPARANDKTTGKPLQTDGCVSDKDAIDELSGSKQALAWASSPNDGGNYWVIHGCDGAGLMNDNLGQNFYIEQFFVYGSTDPTSQPLGYTVISQEQQSQPTVDCSKADILLCWLYHQPSVFTHPGTSIVYSKYNAGMWTNGADWPDKAAGKIWMKNMLGSNIALPTPAAMKWKPTPGSSSEPEAALLWPEGMNDNTPPAAEAFAIMYPWVCNGPFKTEDYSAFWGVDENWGKGNSVPFGKDSKYINCYYDNEPWDTATVSTGYDPHNKSDQPPPVWSAYKFSKPTSTGDIYGWLIAAKYNSDPYGVLVSSITSSTTCSKYNGTWDPDNSKCSATRFSLSPKTNPW